MIDSMKLTSRHDGLGVGIDVTSLVHSLPGMAYRCRWIGTWLMEFVSNGCQRVTGYGARELVLDRDVPWRALVYPDDLHKVTAEVEKAVAERRSFQLVYRIMTADGIERWVMDDGNVVFPALEGTPYLEGFVSDITARKHAEMSLLEANKAINRLIREDPLTGLANRRALGENLARAVSFARRWSQPLALIMADIDHFKVVNDRFGHVAGDNVLVSFARLLKEACRIEDVVARFGGEEFVILLPNTGIDEAAYLASRLQSDTAEATLPIPASITASFGIAVLAPRDTEVSLIARADRALYAAKAGGRNRVYAAAEEEPEPGAGASLLASDPRL